jgi:hypothetical protein
MRKTLNCAGCAAVLCAVLTCAALARPKASSADPPLGINLNGILSYATEIPFADLLKGGSGWLSQVPGKPYGKGPPLAVDAKGWVKQLSDGSNEAQSLFCPDVGLVFGGKQLTCFYEGEGELDFYGNARVVSKSPGKILLEVLPKPGPITLALKKTNPANPVRNIHVVQPGCEDNYQQQPFSPAFVKRWSTFKVLRFMDWQATNSSPLVEWAERSVPDQQTQTGPKGVCLEYLIALANTTGADPWFCMPHKASDDFVRQFATMVKKDLKSTLKVYVEYSNECWNGAFPQAKYCQEQGKKLALSNNANDAQLRYYSQRSVEMFKIWEDVFGGKDRLVRVLAAQAVLPGSGARVMEWKNAYRHADAIAIAPYFGNENGSPTTKEKVAAMSVAEMVKRCRESIAQRRTTTRMYAQKAKQFGLKLIAYEGGQHLVGFYGAENHDPLTDVLVKTNRASEMKDLYLEDLKVWKECGGELYCMFSSMSAYSKWGSWGLLEHEYQDPATAPKYLAALEFMGKR